MNPSAVAMAVMGLMGVAAAVLGYPAVGLVLLILASLIFGGGPR